MSIEDQLTFEFAMRPMIPNLPFTFNPLLCQAKPFIIIGYSEYGRRVGETHHNARVTDAQVERIRDRHEYDGLGYVALSREFGIALTTVRKICTYERRAGRVERWKRINVLGGKPAPQHKDGGLAGYEAPHVKETPVSEIGDFSTQYGEFNHALYYGVKKRKLK